MSKSLSEGTITTRNARAGLKAGLHWRAIDPDVHLGYRKGVRAGKWLVRWYRGDGAYGQVTLATADDALAADGLNVLNFAQATSAARKHVENHRKETKAAAAGPAKTVQEAVEEYLCVRESRERAQLGHGALKRDARSRLSKHVLQTALANKALYKLEAKDFREWRRTLPEALAPATVRRLVNDLKAALNRAAAHHRTQLPAEIEGIIRDGLKADEARSPEARRQVLPEDDIPRLIKAAKAVDDAGNWEGDLYRLILVLAATGARFSQISRMTVGDVQSQQRRLLVPVSRKGRGEKRIEKIALPVGQDVIDALLPAIANRDVADPLLTRWKKIQISPTVWRRDRREPWRSRSEMDRPWAAIVSAAGLPSTTLPYALRHSAIVRNLKFGLPTRLVAALHDTSIAMIEKHYSAYIVDAMEELAARAVVPLVTTFANDRRSLT